jgi:hypothetical protein
MPRKPAIERPDGKIWCDGFVGDLPRLCHQPVVFGYPRSTRLAIKRAVEGKIVRVVRVRDVLDEELLARPIDHDCDAR